MAIGRAKVGAQVGFVKFNSIVFSIATVFLLESCSLSNPVAPSGSNEVVYQTNWSRLRQGQFQLLFQAQRGNAATTVVDAWACIYSNSPSPQLGLNGIFSTVSNPFNTSSMNVWRTVSVTNPAKLYNWSFGAGGSNQSGTMAVPVASSLTFDGIDLTPMLSADPGAYSYGNFKTNIPFPTNETHLLSFSGSQYARSLFSALSNNYSGPTVTNLTSQSVNFPVFYVSLTLENNSFVDLPYPNSVGPWGEGFVAARNSIFFQIEYDFPADFNEPNESTNQPTTWNPSWSNQVWNLDRSADLDWYRVDATNGQIFTLKVRPLASKYYGSSYLNVHFQTASGPSSIFVGGASSNAQWVVTNSGTGAGALLFFRVSGYAEGAYKFDIQSL